MEMLNVVALNTRAQYCENPYSAFIHKETLIEVINKYDINPPPQH